MVRRELPPGSTAQARSNSFAEIELAVGIVNGHVRDPALATGLIAARSGIGKGLTFS